MPAPVDTIVAPATPTGTSALAIVRLSGPACAEIAHPALGSPPLAPRIATHRDYRDLAGELLDDLVATRFVAPQSYTGEDMIELSTHGNPLVVQRVVADLLARGCRLADPGEFTRRAFLNGRIDLAQAEAVMDVIHAQSAEALRTAQLQLRGSLGEYLARLTDDLVLLVAQIEAYIDFPEDDLPTEDRSAAIQRTELVLRGTQRLLATKKYGDVLREGLTTVIVGETNAGKSTLLNRLVGKDRALVSPEPGTTRDYLEEPVRIGRHLLRLIDTAGLNPAAGAVEQLGIGKTLEQALEADLLIWVVDAAKPLPGLPTELRGRLEHVPHVIVANKIDQSELNPDVLAALPAGCCRISALTGEGIATLQQRLEAAAASAQPQHGAEGIAINARHAAALAAAQASLTEALELLRTAGPAELVAAHFRSAMSALGEIVGPIDHERVLDQLFASFCIGK